MAAYNGAEFVVEQLESIRTQTMTIDEVRICDDRSLDNTVGVVQEYIHKHGLEGSWSIEVNTENLGYAGNFMKAAKQTTGDFIFFCDQDDIWIEDRVERMIKRMQENADIRLLGSEFDFFASSEDAPCVPKWEQKRLLNDGTLEKKTFCAENVFIGCQGCTMCVRRTFLEQILPYWHEGWAHDEYVWKLALCMDGLYMYHSYTLQRRLHSNNVSMRKVRDIHQRMKYLVELLASHEATLQYLQDIHAEQARIDLLERNIKAARLRIGLLQEKRLFNTIPLVLCYRDCYHKKRAILVELMMAVIRNRMRGE